MAENRTPPMKPSWRHRNDPERSADPRVQQLLRSLANLEIAPAPQPDFRAELRAQLVAVTPRLVAEGELLSSAPAAGESTRAASTQKPHRTTRSRVKRPLFALTGVLAAFALLLGGAVTLSRHTLPGDTLYGLKRASENTQYGLTSGTTSKGKLKLEFAGRRIGEVAALLPRASALAGGTGPQADTGQLNANTSKLVSQTLASAESDVRTGAQLLGAAAVRGKTAAPLIDMTNWAPAQIAAMKAIVARIPTGNLHDRAAGTLQLIEDADQRDRTLQSELGCSCLATSGTDSLGPIPCATGCSATATTPGQTTGPTPGQSGSGSPSSGLPTSNVPRPVTSGATTQPNLPGSVTTPRVGVPSSSGLHLPIPSGAPTLPTLPGLPTLPVHKPTLSKPTLLKPTLSKPTLHTTLPVGVSSSCVHASLGPVGVGVGNC